MEERYIKIDKCSDCPFCGISYDKCEKEIINICSNPINYEIEQIPAEKVGNEYYPIISVGRDTSIPWWCKQPK